MLYLLFVIYSLLHIIDTYYRGVIYYINKQIGFICIMKRTLKKHLYNKTFTFLYNLRLLIVFTILYLGVKKFDYYLKK